jgi:hypothetical protein
MSATITRLHPDPAHADNVHLIDEVEVLLQSVIRRACDAANDVWTKPRSALKFTAGPRIAASANSRPASAPVSSNVMQGKLSWGRRAFRAISRFVISALVGVVATLAWQSYGDAAKRALASWYPQLPLWTLLISTDQGPKQIAFEGSAVPATPSHSTSVEPTAPIETTTASAASAPDRQQLEMLGSIVAAARQQLEQFAAKQEQMARDVANLQSADQEINRKFERLLLRRPSESPEHRPMPPLPPLRTLPPSGSVAGAIGALH